MFKRLWWMTIGIGLGFGSSLWIQRSVKRAARRYVPPVVSRHLGRVARRATIDLQALADEVRIGVHQAERELNAPGKELVRR